ncbi:predicted protein [Sclerotinia sclerotiorum 1980 UF-70]|uniref:Uncharacterized protein n=1 Tax=Sclerotinia sclerotiorum (strain ATCC 18683 / 1980 / Ss-1) TaxID=665079 RepID=A7EKN8_SCLS1|nr:predicted protein [Sclerotinia sclerotiorum 1980 UF-70]EDO03404.1 predicted protein [Sclerotinia sclerotiorum 1980 UF-70]
MSSIFGRHKSLRRSVKIQRTYQLDTCLHRPKLKSRGPVPCVLIKADCFELLLKHVVIPLSLDTFRNQEPEICSTTNPISCTAWGTFMFASGFALGNEPETTFYLTVFHGLLHAQNKRLHLHSNTTTIHTTITSGTTAPLAGILHSPTFPHDTSEKLPPIIFDVYVYG